MRTKPGPNIRDRVAEFRRIPSAELRDNAGNWRTLPYGQQQGLAGLLGEVGIAGALTAYHSERSERNDGALTLIGGHLRKSAANTDWPVLILDVTDEEADKLLTVYDPLGAMAETDGAKLRDLLNNVETESTGLTDLLASLRHSLLNANAASESIPAEPKAFMEYGEDIATEFCCPKCGYKWSGKPK